MALSGKTAIVTGGSGGIGFATAHNYLKDGVVNLVLLDVANNEENVQQLRDEFQQANIVLLLTDITKRDDVELTFKQVLERFQRIDIVVNCAGLVHEMDLNRTMNVNLIGLINTSLVAMNAMSKVSGGHGGIIVNVSSIAGLIPIAGTPFYSASKHGVIGFTRAMGDDFYYLEHGVKFTAVCPGFTQTPLLQDPENQQGVSQKAREWMAKFTVTFPIQTADQCGKNISIITGTTGNGAVWILDNGKIEEVSIPAYI